LFTAKEGKFRLTKADPWKERDHIELRGKRVKREKNEIGQSCARIFSTGSLVTIARKGEGRVAREESREPFKNAAGTKKKRVNTKEHPGA